MKNELTKMTITLTREEAQQVLDALNSCGEDWIADGEWETQVDDYDHELVAKALETLRARLSAPEPEPVAWLKKDRSSIEVSIMSAEYMKNAGFEPLYTAPPQREWQSLTDEERTYLAWESNNGPHCVAMTEAKLKEKNT